MQSASLVKLGPALSMTVLCTGPVVACGKKTDDIAKDKDTTSADDKSKKPKKSGDDDGDDDDGSSEVAKLCAHMEKVVAKAKNAPKKDHQKCVDDMTKMKKDDPDAYKCVTKCDAKDSGPDDMMDCLMNCIMASKSFQDEMKKGGTLKDGDDDAPKKKKKKKKSSDDDD